MSDRERPPLHKRKSFQFAIGLAVTVGCLYWAFRQMAADENPRQVFQQIGDAFQQADYVSTLPLMWIVLFVFYWLKAWRWRMLLAPLGMFRPIADLLPAILIGFAFNNLLPARIGEFVRVFVFSSRHRLSKVSVLASVALERILDAIAILAIFGLGAMFLPDVAADVRNKAMVAAGVAAFGVACVAVYLIWTRPFVHFAEWCMDSVPILPAAVRRKIAGILEAGAAGLASLKQGRLLAGILLTSFAQWALNGLLVYLSLRAFHLDLPWHVSAVLLGVVAFGVAAPSTPGYFGVIQVCFLIVLSLFVEDQKTVFAASIYFHMAQYVPVTLAGVICFNRMGLSVAEVREEAEHQTPAASTAPAADVRSD